MDSKRFREWRKGRKLSQARAGEMFGVARETVLRWEKGRTMPVYVGIMCGLYDAIDHAKACRALEGEK